MTTHTPTPWIFDDSKKHYTRPVIRYNGCIVSVFSEVGDDIDKARIKADGNFIVTACNAHAAMKHALRMARKKLEMWPEGMNPEYFPEIKAIDAALALADGKENQS